VDKKVNLSEWALNNQTLVKYFLILFMILGVFSYLHLNQKEDPEFTFLAMVVQVGWPGATEAQMEDQVVDKIEKKLLELSTLDYTQTFIKPGYAQITINLRDSSRGTEVTDSWYQVRKKIGDIKSSLPNGVQGPYFNDEFGDTYSNILSFTGDGYNPEQLRRVIENVKRELLQIPGVEKADLLGTQTEQISVDISSSKIAALGIDVAQVIAAIRNQNSISPAGVFDTKNDRYIIRVSGNFTNIDDIRNLPLSVDDKVFKLGDVAIINRQFAQPPSTMIHHNGTPTILLALTVKKSADVIATGHDVDELISKLKPKLPLGVKVAQVADQAEVVTDSINEFSESLAEAVIIVLGVSFLSLGFRTGIVVAISIPLVLAITFLIMYIYHIDLQRISLGALIISLGLLVDDAIISVEMMMLKLEEGYTKFKAATFAYTSTAFPMLTGTLITTAGFLPVGLAKSSTGSYVFTLFAVVGISLVVSWFVAVIFTPFLGFHLLPTIDAGHAHSSENAVLEKPFYKKFKNFLLFVIKHKKLVVIATVGIFMLSIALFGKFVQQQFFPASNRNEILVDLWLPEGASIYDTESSAAAIEKAALAQAGVKDVTTFIGIGAPRFYLSLDQQNQNINYAQLLIMAKDNKVRGVIKNNLTEILKTQYPNIRGRVTFLENGPPVGYPVQFRVSGSDPKEVRKYANQVEDIMRQNKQVLNVNDDWGEDLKSFRFVVDQSKAQALGISSADIENQLNSIISGLNLTDYYDRDETLSLVARLDKRDRSRIDEAPNFMVQIANNKFVPVGEIAKLEFYPETSLRYRRSRVPTITVRSDITPDAQGNDVSKTIFPKLQELEKTLPLGYHIAIGGSLESSKKAQASINAVMPLTVIAVLTLLMLQLNSFSRMGMVVLTAPLGMIGVTLALILFHAPFGFVALLGVIALFGIIMRNSVILIVQVETHIKEGMQPLDAILQSTLLRFRPIVLTAIAAVLGMIPLAGDPFWGPMAKAMMGGLTVATALTLIFLPALYAIVFKIKLDGK
jgi:multidrug efflux pump